MKCLCGYERIEDHKIEERTKEEPEFKNGDEDFHRSQSPIRIKMSDAPFSDQMEDRYLHACPKCGNVKIEFMEW